MQLPESLLKQWCRQSRAASRNLEITEDGVVLGKTVLAAFSNGHPVIDQERVVTMLSAAYGKEIPAAVVDSFRHAERCFKRGDKALANMHLALTGVQAVDLKIAQRLFAADWALHRGITTEQLRRIAGVLRKDDDGDDSDDDNSDDDDSVDSGNGHYNPDEPRIPAGQSGGGQWTTGDGTTSGRGSISADDIRSTLTDEFNNPSTLPQETEVAANESIQSDASSEVQIAADIPTAILNLLNGSTPDPDRPNVSGVVPQLNRPGDLNTAYQDFNSLSLTNVQVYDNGTKVGTLPDGNRAIVRPLSTPTIEIQDATGTTLYKIRYK